jgi:hypothetical protein
VGLADGEAPAFSVNWFERLSFRDRALVIAVVAVHVILLFGPVDVLSPVKPHAIGAAIWHGKVPYRDFGFEYPPLAILAFLLPGLVPSGVALSVMALQELGWEALAVIVVLRHHPSALRRYALLSLLVWPFLSGGFDALPMAAIAISTAWLVEDRASAWWVAAAGALAKLSPAAAWVWGRRHLVVAGVALVVTVGLGLIPAALAKTSTSSYIGYTAKRGVEVESVASTTKWLADELTGTDSHFAYRFKSWEIDGAKGLATTWTALAALGVLLVAALAGRDGPPDPWLASFTTILLLLIGFRVLSPQYIAWPAPLAAVLGGRWWRTWMVVAGLTMVTYLIGGTPNQYLAIILVRNAVLVVCAVWALARLAGGQRPRTVASA